MSDWLSKWKSKQANHIKLTLADFLHKYRVYGTLKKHVLLQTEEEFLDALTKGFPDESVDGDEEEDDSDESEEEEGDEEQGERSQNGGRRQSLHLPVEGRVNVAPMVSALQQEGETFLKYLINSIKENGIFIQMEYLISV